MTLQEIGCFFIHSIFTMDDITKGALLGIVGSLVGVFLGGIISKNSAIDIMRIKDFNNAASEFRDAFTQEQIRIRRESPSVVIYGIAIAERNSQFFAAQEKAMVKFRYFVSESDIIGFDIAWQFYSKGWHQWLQDCSNNSDKGINDFISHYFHLLDYTKPK